MKVQGLENSLPGIFFTCGTFQERALALLLSVGPHHAHGTEVISFSVSLAVLFILHDRNLHSKRLRLTLPMLNYSSRDTAALVKQQQTDLLGNATHRTNAD